MTDLFLAMILAVMLIQWHYREKDTGWYGKLNMLITKRFKRYIKNKLKWCIATVKGRYYAYRKNK